MISNGWKPRLVSTVALAAALLALAPASRAADTCSQPVSTGSEPVVRDCIQIARASIGAVSCRDCVCDVNGSGTVSIADALRCLWFVVGGEVTLDCPACNESTTTTEPACASCSEALFHTADVEDLCESSRVLYDAMIDCPCDSCAEECAGICQTDSMTTVGRECAACSFDQCRSRVHDCLED
jgi:hypothetical protein